MKKLLMISTFFALMLVVSLSCEKDSVCAEGTPRGNKPGAPFGSPDDTDTYTSGEYISVTYTYYCHNGQYRAVTYTSLDACTAWERSDYTSSCIEK